jgi:hypothetical protein
MNVLPSIDRDKIMIRPFGFCSFVRLIVEMILYKKYKRLNKFNWCPVVVLLAFKSMFWFVKVEVLMLEYCSFKTETNVALNYMWKGTPSSQALTKFSIKGNRLYSLFNVFLDSNNHSSKGKNIQNLDSCWVCRHVYFVFVKIPKILELNVCWIHKNKSIWDYDLCILNERTVRKKQIQLNMCFFLAVWWVLQSDFSIFIFA